MNFSIGNVIENSVKLRIKHGKIEQWKRRIIFRNMIVTVRVITGLRMHLKVFNSGKINYSLL